MIDLDRDEKLCEAATPGPWRREHENVHSSQVCTCRGAESNWYEVWSESPEWTSKGIHQSANAEFIAQARTLLPEYIAEVRRLREENEKLKLSENHWDALNEKLNLIGGERDAFELIAVELRDWQRRAVEFFNKDVANGYHDGRKELIEEAK